MDAVILEYLRKAYAERQYETYQSLMQCAVQLLKEAPNRDDWRKAAINKIYHNLSMFIKHYPHIRMRNDKIKPVTVGKQLEIFLTK